MAKQTEPPKALKKIIDIPGDIVKDLKKMAVDADKDLKTYIQHVLVELVHHERNKRS